MQGQAGLAHPTEHQDIPSLLGERGNIRWEDYDLPITGRGPPLEHVAEQWAMPLQRRLKRHTWLRHTTCSLAWALGALAALCVRWLALVRALQPVTLELQLQLCKALAHCGWGCGCGAGSAACGCGGHMHAVVGSSWWYSADPHRLGQDSIHSGAKNNANFRSNPRG
jgi:hypothetical protein